MTKKIIIRPKSGIDSLPQKQVMSDTSGQLQNTTIAGTITLPKTLLLSVLGFMLCLIVGLLALLQFRSNDLPPKSAVASPQHKESNLNPLPEEMNNDFPLDEYTAAEDLLTENINLGKYLSARQISEPVVRELMQQAENKGLEYLEKNHEITTLTPKDGNPEKQLILYKMSPQKTMLFKLGGLPTVEVRLKKLANHLRAAGGIVKTTLWEAILDYNIHYRVLEQMEDAMKWSVDFYHLQPGDKFKVIYEEKRAGNEIVGIGKLHAVYFKTSDAEHWAYLIEDVEKLGYYGDNGKPVKKTFLRCPVKYERITSTYNLARLHPVTGELKPHFGTDFAAPAGSPIFSVADGTVETADFTVNNGNYVKIRHDNVIETQYLHMERFGEGIRAGAAVQQGQVIGYVGQTGLATGPHVCFRFWKNGQQLDPRNEPDNQPFYMSLKDQARYLSLKGTLEQQLREIVYFDGKF